MLIFAKRTVEELTPAIEAATEAFDDPREWAELFLGNLSLTLSKNPLQYRSFGAWWWVLKKELVAYGIDNFGTDSDAEWIEKATYSDSVTNIVASFLYHRHQANIGLIFEATHQVEYTDNEGDIITKEYHLYDVDMEVLAAGQR